MKGRARDRDKGQGRRLCEPARVSPCTRAVMRRKPSRTRRAKRDKQRRDNERRKDGGRSQQTMHEFNDEVKTRERERHRNRVTQGIEPQSEAPLRLSESSSMCD